MQISIKLCGFAQGFLEHGAAKLAVLDFDADQGSRAVDELGTKFTDRKKDIIFRSADVTGGPKLDSLVHSFSTELMSLLELQGR